MLRALALSRNMINIWFLSVCLFNIGYFVKPVTPAHFMGGHFHWRPINPRAFDGRVQITHRIAWKRDRDSTSTGCNQTTIESEALIGSSSSLTCQSGCTGTIGHVSYYCTDFSEIDNWSAGERTYNFTFNRTTTHFEALFSGNAWISLVTRGGNWAFKVNGSFIHRQDTGMINSAPVVNILPQIRLQHGCSHTIRIPVVDPDGDNVRCRWAESFLNECGGVCRSFPANLNERDCELQYTATGLAGRYAVALQVEDFASPSDSTPLSSVPVQFLVLVFSSTQPCFSRPELVGKTPHDGSCIGVPFNSIWSTRITARVSSTIAHSIVDIVTASPFGMRKSNLTQCDNEWYVNVTWSPSDFQNGPNIFCYSAMDNTGKTSLQRCITLLVGVQGPVAISDSVSPTGEVLANNSIVWTVTFDRQFVRPPRERYIRLFEEGGSEVFSINVATSSAVTYPSDAQGRTLSFRIDYPLPEKRHFYVLLDQG